MKFKIVPMVTSFREGHIDTKLLEGHAKHLLDSGIDYLFLMGSTGLGPALSFDERRTCIDALAKYSERIICQVGSLNFDDSLRLAEYAKAKRFEYLGALPPYYFPRLPESLMVKYFSKLSSIHPTILYNFPLTTGYDISPQTIKLVNESGGKIVGIKDTVTDVSHMLLYKWELGKDFLVFCGPDSLILPALNSGLDGAVPGTGNYIPNVIGRLFQDANTEKGMQLQRLVTLVSKLAQKYGQWSANYSLIRLLKNYDAGSPRAPIFPLSAEEEKNLGLDVAKLLPNGDSP